MTRKIQVHQVDAFTRTPFTGNPAGVVLNADSLDDAQMLAIARELNNADTAFILSPDGSDHDVRAKFFTPRVEALAGGPRTLRSHLESSELCAAFADTHRADARRYFATGS